MNTRNSFLVWLTSLLFGGLLAGCAVATLPATGDVSAIHTLAVQTVSARLTLDAGSTAVAILTQLAQPTVTPTANLDFTSTPTLFPDTFTPVPPSPTPVPPTSTPTTSSSTPCDWLQFVSDITVPDGKEYLPGVQFTKTWRLKNIGGCTWTRDYALVFFEGDQMSGPTVVYLTGVVPPGASVDLSVGLTSPATEGTYAGYWLLRNADGLLYGGEEDADEPFMVRIKVDLGDDVLYNFAARYCKADWTNSRLALPCPSPIEDELIGFVSKDDSPRMETGTREDEPALITHPDRGGFMRFDFLGDQGLIAGTFPDQLIEDGDRFEAVIGCMFGHDECNVLFYLLIQKPNGKYEVLASWQEYYDGQVHTVSVDLSEWAGKEINLVLVVTANGSSQGDYAFWLSPSLMR